jgi:hypothetical protein
MKRSGIRETLAQLNPDFGPAGLHPDYGTAGKKEGRARHALLFTTVIRVSGS